MSHRCGGRRGFGGDSWIIILIIILLGFGGRRF